MHSSKIESIFGIFCSGFTPSNTNCGQGASRFPSAETLPSAWLEAPQPVDHGESASGSGRKRMESMEWKKKKRSWNVNWSHLQSTETTWNQFKVNTCNQSCFIPKFRSFSHLQQPPRRWSGRRLPCHACAEARRKAPTCRTWLERDPKKTAEIHKKNEQYDTLGGLFCHLRTICVKILWMGNRMT